MYKPLLEGDLSGDGDLRAVALDGHVVGELTNLAVDLDAGVEERLLHMGGQGGRMGCREEVPISTILDKRRELCRPRRGYQARQGRHTCMHAQTKAAMSKISSWTGWLASIVNRPDLCFLEATTFLA